MAIPKEIRELLSKHDLTVLSVTLNKHAKIRLQAPDGRTYLLICSRSPSDHRAIQNINSDIERMLRAHA